MSFYSLVMLKQGFEFGAGGVAWRFLGNSTQGSKNPKKGSEFRVQGLGFRYQEGCKDRTLSRVISTVAMGIFLLVTTHEPPSGGVWFGF